METYTYKSSQQAAVGVAATAVYTVPAATTAIALGLTLTNILTARVLATVLVNNGSTDYNRAFQIPLNPGQTIYPLGNETWNLPTTYVVKVQSDTAASIDAVLDYVEIS